MFSMKLLFNNYFQLITKNLDLLEWLDEPKFNIFNEIDIIINKFGFNLKLLTHSLPKGFQKRDLLCI